MATCEICGTEFDDLGVQVVLPGLGKSFDRIDCAVRARNLAGASTATVPMRGTLVALGPRSGARSFALGGLSAGLAAALAGSRARVAVGGATVGVALLIATTAHLASRGGDATEVTARPKSLAPPARYAGDFGDRVRAAAIARTVAEPSTRAQREVRFVLLSARRSPGAAPGIRPDAPPGTHNPKPARPPKPPTGEKPPPTGGEPPTPGGKPPTGGKPSHGGKTDGWNPSTRPGWGWGDKNHTHTGPGKHKESNSNSHENGGQQKQSKSEKRDNGHKKK